MKKEITHRKKLIYIPGIISLIIFPLISLWFLNNRPLVKYSMLEVIWWDFATVNESKDWPLNNLIADRDYKIVILKGKEKEDSSNLREADNLIERMVSTKDTIHGIHFKFSDKAKYWTLVKALDICNREIAVGYVPTFDGIFAYILPNAVYPKDQLFVCGNILEKEKETIRIYKISSFLRSNKIQSALFFLFFFLLCFLAYKYQSRLN